MAEQSLRFLIDAENRAESTIKEVERQLDSVSQKTKQLQPAFKAMTAVGVAGFTAITGAVTLCVKAAAESEKQWAIVGRQIELAGLDIGNTTKEVMKFATETQKLTGYSDEYVGMLVGRFLPTTKNLEESQKLARIALDMEASGMVSAENAMKGLMAAREGDIEMLKRYIPQLRGVDAETLKSMSSAEKYKYVLELLEGQFGGTAEAAGKTFAGQLKILKETFNDLQERIGEQFLPILTSIVQNITPVIDKIMEWVEKNPELTKNIIMVTGAIFGLITVVGMLGMALPSIISGFSMLLGPVGLVIVALGLLGKVIFDNKEKVLEFVQDPMAKLKTIWETISDIVSNVIVPKLKEFWETLKLLWGMAADFLTPAFEKLHGNLIQLWTALQNLWNTISPYLIPALQFLATVIGAALYGAILLVIRIITELGNLFVWLLGKATETITGIINWFVKLYEEIKSSWNALGNFFKDLWDGIKETFREAIDWIMDKLRPLLNAIERVKEGVGSVVSGVGGTAKRIFGGGQFGIDYVPRTGAYLLHKGERVVPAGALAGGGSVVVNINGGYYLSERAAEEIGDMIIKKLKGIMKL